MMDIPSARTVQNIYINSEERLSAHNLYWGLFNKAVKISEIVEQLRANGEVISDSALSHISLLSYKHVIPMGTYFVEEDE
ncbi:MAG: transposase [Gammaproteobacteria bacterium]|nr:transposase [Gammaproteobacteria bacterium]